MVGERSDKYDEDIMARKVQKREELDARRSEEEGQ
jgi:hypothetical protein